MGVDNTALITGVFCTPLFSLSFKVLILLGFSKREKRKRKNYHTSFHTHFRRTRCLGTTKRHHHHHHPPIDVSFFLSFFLSFSFSLHWGVVFSLRDLSFRSSFIQEEEDIAPSGIHRQKDQHRKGVTTTKL